MLLNMEAEIQGRGVVIHVPHGAERARKLEIKVQLISCNDREHLVYKRCVGRRWGLTQDGGR